MAFWAFAGSVPAFWVVYSVAHMDDDKPNKQPLLTRLIDRYTVREEELRRIHAAHMDMMERAAMDRALFVNSSAPVFVDMKFPEYVRFPSVLHGLVGREGMEVWRAHRGNKRKWMVQATRKDIC